MILFNKQKMLVGSSDLLFQLMYNPEIMKYT